MEPVKQHEAQILPENPDTKPEGLTRRQVQHFTDDLKCQFKHCGGNIVQKTNYNYDQKHNSKRIAKSLMHSR